MNCKSFNTINLDEILEILGYFPTKQNEKEAWYLNPFSIETQASFKYNKKMNKWYLFSDGTGGNNIEFTKRYFGCSIESILKWASEQKFSSFHQHNFFEEKRITKF